MAKRYSLVRVDNIRPELFEKIRKELVCVTSRAEEGHLTCERCLYGDTKEQLISKVAQIRFKQEIKYGSKDMLKAFYNMCYRQAKEIIEFLGVEE